MNILLVYPEHPETFWSFKYALRFVAKKSALPPLGLLTVASLLPAGWNRKLVDCNVSALRDRDLAWADYVFISAMSVQRESALRVIERCRRAEVKIVAGGPLFTVAHAEFPQVDHFVLGEAEITLPRFVHDAELGQALPCYHAEVRCDLSLTPAPQWDLLPLRRYASMCIQYSRGCPFHCDFCDITELYGRRTRTKNRNQLLNELNGLYARGWRGAVFFVDDNFIGNTVELKTRVLPAVAAWMRAHRYPFRFYTQASINLADDEALMTQMTQAGFDMVFIGIESPDEASLQECSKTQNRNRDLLASIRKCQAAGLQVQAGFIVGFDHDSPAIFERQIAFIQKSGIATAMVGILSALKGTRLHARLAAENRLIHTASGNNTDGSLNFIPKMNPRVLLDGYWSIISQIYSPAHYYSRVVHFLKNYRPPRFPFRLQWSQVGAFFKSIFRLGVLGRERRQYWRLLSWSLFRSPRHFPLAVTLAIYGYHFRRVFEKLQREMACAVPDHC